MKVLYAASEITPFASTGGLADAAAALPRALGGLGVEVARVMPMYRSVLEGSFRVENTGVVLSVPIGFRSLRAEVWKASEPGPPTYFIRRDEFFDRGQLYNLPHRDYDDNFERFVFFQKAVVAMLDQLKLGVEVVHCNDWQTGLLPSFLAHGIQGSWRGHKERTVFTIHNLGYQGIFSGNDYSMTNLPFSCFSVETMEFYGNINCVKNGITSSDLVTTVSPTYAREIQQAEDGFGLHGVLTAAKDRLRGILNGIDAESYDPATDPGIARNFSAADLSGKAACRKALLAAVGLPVNAGVPVLGIITRLTEQKGMDLLTEALPALMELDLAVVLLGRGETKYEEACRAWKTRWPGKVAVKIAYDAALARSICAGADLLLMPSRYEPCGLQQLYALRYGTVPVVRAVGGLEDTVIDVDSTQPRGYGFKFAEYKASALVACLRRALALYQQPEAWRLVQQTGMAQDYSWPRFAREYLAVYERALAMPRKA